MLFKKEFPTATNKGILKTVQR